MPTLFDPVTFRSITLKNRLAVSPMCMYSSVDGHANDFHLVHLGSRAIGGFALIFAEATAVTAEGRITPDDAGLWKDSQIEPLARITNFVKQNGAVPAIQLAHAGRKASTSRPFNHPTPHSPLPVADGGWSIGAASPIPFDPSYATPRELTIDEIHGITQSFVDAAKRALLAGYQILEIHAAHGYLLNSFLSPLTNKRTDVYGGSFENRSRFLLETVAALRKNIPDGTSLFVRLSATEWLDNKGGWNLNDSIALAKLLKHAGVDLIDCSSGGNSPDAKPPMSPGFQVPFAAAIKQQAGIATAAVGVITDPHQAAHIIEQSQADLIFLAREALRDPYFPIHAARALQNPKAIPLPPQYARRNIETKETTMGRNIAEVFIETLIAANIKRVYGLVGDSLNGLTEVIRKSKDIQWLHVRHEEVAAFAAGAEAHLTGNLTVCAGSCGPGNLHLINGLFDCHRSRVPVLAIAAQIPTAEIGSAYFQETHPQNLFQECSCFCETLSHPSQMPHLIAIAMRTAIAKRGVAVIIIPGDVALQPSDAKAPELALSTIPSSILPPASDLDAAVGLLNKAEKVTILGGAGCQGAHDELIALAHALKAPIVHALRGKEFIEYDNPFDVGMTGLLGFSSGYYAMMNADTLLMLGTDFPYRQFFPQHATIIQVDARGEQIGRRTPVKLGLIGTVKDTVDSLTPRLNKKTDRTHLDKCLHHYAGARKQLDDLATGEPESKLIHPQYVAKILNELAAPDAIFTCDVGTPTIWAARYLKMNGQRRLLGSFIHGSMASALPQAIGAQAAFPDRQVVTLSGDGGFAMLLGDLLSLKQLNLPIKMVVFNNHSLGFVQLEMKAAGLLDFGTNLENPNFAQLAQTTGLLGLRVEKNEQLQPAIAAALAHPGPALVDVVVNPLELSMPPTITAQQALGFGLYATKAILSGRGTEVIDLAKTNLFR